MNDLFAIIDLGSNTFHILIVKAEKGKITTIFKQRNFVALGEGGLGVIRETAFNRGLKTLSEYRKILDKYNVENFRAIGTAALRSASNGLEFTAKVNKLYNISIELINGHREAELIHKGVSLLIPLSETPTIIMDIGGGSVEFILVNEDHIWSDSFDVGIGVLFSKFGNSDPISNQNQKELFLFLDHKLEVLTKKLKERNHIRFVGASGSFEIIQSMNGFEIEYGEICKIGRNDFDFLFRKIIKSSLEERLTMPGLPTNRAKLVVVALLLVKYVWDLINSEEIVISPYALKEGLIKEWIAS